MKKYQLSNTSKSFIEHLKCEEVKYKISEDGKAIFVWCYCDQDLFDLGKLYDLQNKENNKQLTNGEMLE